MIRSADLRAGGRAAIASALLVLMAPTPLLAQPFRAQTAPPPAPSLEARQAFQAKIAEQVQLFTKDRLFARLPQNKQQAVVEFVVGNVLFVATHAMGRALLLDMNVPTLAGAEQAADDFAILTALKLGEKDFSDRVLIEAAKGWFANARREKKVKRMHYYNRHGFNLRRAYRIVCLMVGADQARFSALAEETMLPKDLRRTCGWDYDKALRSWANVLTPDRTGQPKARIEVRYAAATGKLEVYARMFRNLRFLETIAELSADRFAWSAPIVMEMRSCGGADAAWTGATRTLHVCYEMAQDFAELSTLEAKR
jgi:Putative metallopeptidase